MNLPKQFSDEMSLIVPKFDDFLRSYEMPPTRAFRVNNQKIDDKSLLSAIGEHEALPFEHCYYLAENEKWGAHPIHHAGLMYIQEPSAMASVNAFDVKAELALDLCAAPGGKTIQLAGKVGCLISNEINPSRAAVLKSNVERMGLRNVAVTNHSPKELIKLGEIFDLVLADVPCSGEGMFRKDEEAIREWSVEHSVSCATRQSAILESADKLIKKGGMLIYSTCTFSKRENEDVLERFMAEHDYELVTPGSQAIAQTTYLTDERMRRFYPHIGRGEGQFFAALIKRGGSENKLPKGIKYGKNKAVTEFLNQTIGKDLNYCEYGGNFYVPALPFELPLSKIVSGGVKIGRMEKSFKPDHYFFSAYGKETFCVEPSEEELKRYLHGEELAGEHIGYGAITVLGAPLGGFKGSDGRYKNLYPKGLRI